MYVCGLYMYVHICVTTSVHSVCESVCVRLYVGVYVYPVYMSVHRCRGGTCWKEKAHSIRYFPDKFSKMCWSPSNTPY